MEPRSRLRAAFLVFNGVDILDFAGPLEIFSHVHHGMDFTSPDPAFELVTVGSANLVTSSATVKLCPDITLADARSHIADFDILVIPGGPPHGIRNLVESNAEQLQLLTDFSDLPP
jgi:putative intracellular protease/amidase